MKSNHNRQPSVRKNFIYSMFFQVFSVIVPFITAPYLSRVLGAGPLGVQSYTASVQSYFKLVALLGTAGYGAREIARTRDNRAEYSRLFWEIELLSILTSMVSILGWCVVILHSSEYSLYYTIMILNLFAAMLNIDWFYRGLEQFQFIVLRNTGFKIFSILLIFLLVKKPEDLWLYIGIQAVTTLLSSLTLWTYLPGLLDKVPLKELRIARHFRETLLYFIPSIATSIYTALDKTLIGLITHVDAENGYYEQAEKIIGMAKSVSYQALNSVIGMRISYLFAKNELDEIKQRIEKSYNYIYFMGFGCAFGVAGIAENFVPFFFGAGYERVITLLYIFAPIIVVVGTSSCLGGHYYTPAGKRTTSTKFLIVGACANFLLNLLMIPKWGAVGAAIASVTAEGLIAALYVRYSNGFCTPELLMRTGWKKLVSGTVMFVIVRLIGRMGIMNPLITLFVQVSVGVAVYGLLLILMKDEWVHAFLRQMFDKLKKHFA